MVEHPQNGIFAVQEYANLPSHEIVVQEEHERAEELHPIR